MLHAHFTAVCYRHGVIDDGLCTMQGCGFVPPHRFPLRVYTVYWMVVDLFCSCNLDLDPITFIYELDTYSLEIYGMCR